MKRYARKMPKDIEVPVLLGTALLFRNGTQAFLGELKPNRKFSHMVTGSSRSAVLSTWVAVAVLAKVCTYSILSDERVFVGFNPPHCMDKFWQLWGCLFLFFLSPLTLRA